MQNLSLVNFLTTNANNVLFAELTAKTVVKLNKRGNPYTTVTKTKTTIVTINSNYQDAVNQQRAIESKNADFNAVAPVWGENLTNSLVKYNGNFYLQVIENGTVGKTVYHDENGNVLSFDDFKRFLPTKNQTSRQDVEDVIIVKKYKIENVKKLVIRSPMLLVFTNE